MKTGRGREAGTSRVAKLEARKPPSVFHPDGRSGTSASARARARGAKTRARWLRAIEESGQECGEEAIRLAGPASFSTFRERESISPENEECGKLRCGSSRIEL